MVWGNRRPLERCRPTFGVYPEKENKPIKISLRQKNQTRKPVKKRLNMLKPKLKGPNNYRSRKDHGITDTTARDAHMSI